jgi:hypothetical protein
MALPGTGGSMCITAPADDRKGWTDGPARDPARVTGSADRHRPRRAPARRAATAPAPVPRHPLALTAGRPSGRSATTESPTGDRGSLPPPPRSSIRQTKRRRSSSRRRFVRVRGPAGTLREHPEPPGRTRVRHSAYAAACRMSVVPARQPSYGRSGASDGMPNEGSGSHGRDDARGGWGRRIARSSPFDPRGAHRPRGLTPRVIPDIVWRTAGLPIVRPSGPRSCRGLAPDN